MDMSRWSKRSQEDKERVLREQVNPTHRWAKEAPPFDRIKPECDKAKKNAGNEEKHCSACDLRCPNCPFESAWSKQEESSKDFYQRYYSNLKKQKSV